VAAADKISPLQTQFPSELDGLKFPLKTIRALELLNLAISPRDVSFQLSMALGNRYGAKGAEVHTIMKPMLHKLFDVEMRAKIGWNGVKRDTAHEAAGSAHSERGFRAIDKEERIMNAMREGLRWGQRKQLSKEDDIEFYQQVEAFFSPNVAEQNVNPSKTTTKRKSASKNQSKDVRRKSKKSSEVDRNSHRLERLEDQANGTSDEANETSIRMQSPVVANGTSTSTTPVFDPKSQVGSGSGRWNQWIPNPD